MANDPQARLIEVTKPPSAAILNANVFFASSGKSNRSDDWKEVTYVRPKVVVNEKKAQKYAKVCGYSAAQGVPMLLPHIEAFPLAMMLFASDAFPYRAMGLIHLGNRATQHQCINAGDELRIEVQTGELYIHKKGQAMTLHARALRDGILVWDSTWTFLRTKAVNLAGTPYLATLPENMPLTHRADILAKPGITRQYAMISGDVNPIHLSHLSAKLMGFRRIIAHGMWTKARAQAALMPQHKIESCNINVEFKSPLFPPAKTALWAMESGSGIHFEIRDDSGERTHLRGEMQLPAETRV